MYLYTALKIRTKSLLFSLAGRKTPKEALTLVVGERLAFTTTLVLLICATFLYYAFEASGPVVLLSGLLLTKTSDLYRLPVEEIKIN